MESLRDELNPAYKQEIIIVLQNNIRMHLSLLLSGGYRYIPGNRETLRINDQGVYYSDLDSQRLTTPQVSVILLEVVDFLFRNDGEIGLDRVESSIIDIPSTFTRSIQTRQEIGDLFGEIPMPPSVFCLSQVFHILRGKLSYRQTGLYHLLFLKTCLMMERQNVPPDFILGKEYNTLDWFALVRRYLVPNDNVGKGIRINIDGIENYSHLWEEIEELYRQLYITGFYMNYVKNEVTNS